MTSFLKSYSNKIIQYDLVNKFNYRHLNHITKLNKIVLNFGYTNSNFQKIISGLLALEQLTSKKGQITESNSVNILLKIKKGTPVGCKIVLHNNIMYEFYLTLLLTVLPKLPQRQSFHLTKTVSFLPFVSFNVKNPLLFPKLEAQYQVFKDLPNLNITLCLNAKFKTEIYFLLKSLKFFN